MRGFYRRLLILTGPALAVCFMPLVLSADMSWEETAEQTLMVGNKSTSLGAGQTNIRINDNVVVMQDKTGGNIRYINLSTRDFVTLSLKKRTFTRDSESQLRSKASQEISKEHRMVLNRQRQAQADKSPQALTPDKELLMQGKLKLYESLKTPMRAQITSEQDTIEGHPCTKYIVRSGNEIIAETWVAQDIEIDSWYKKYAGIATSLDPLSKRILSSIPGFPVKITYYFGPLTYVITVKHFSTSEIPLSELLLPENAVPHEIN